jgi:hypothetical protein
VRAAHLFFGLAGGLSLAACAGILGIDDRNLDTQGGDASTGEGGPTSDDGGGPGQPDGGAGGNDGSSPTDGGGGGNDAGLQGDAAVCPDPCTYAKGLDFPFEITSDANNVYWTEFGDAEYSSNGAVKSCPVSGCGSGPTIIAQGLINPRGLAVDAKNIYFGTSGTAFQAGNGGVWTCPLSGCNGSPKQLASASAPFGIALDATYVYWVDYQDYTVHRLAKSGSGGDDMLYDGGGVVTDPTHCVVDANNIFFTDWNRDLYRLPIAGGPLVTVTSWGGQAGVWPLVIDTSNIYFGTEGAILRVAKTAVNADGGTPVANGIVDPDELALDDAGVLYYSNAGSSGSDGTVGKVKVAGGGAGTIAASQPSTEAVTITGSYVFWLTNGLPDAMGNAMPNTGTVVRSTR